MLDLASRINVTEERRKETRRALLREVTPAETIVFGPAKPKHTVIVFTDADSPYCRKFHEELGELGQQLGIPGTPMIVLSDGTSVGGYMPPDKLVAALEEHAEAAGNSD